MEVVVELSAFVGVLLVDVGMAVCEVALTVTAALALMALVMRTVYRWWRRSQRMVVRNPLVVVIGVLSLN